MKEYWWENRLDEVLKTHDGIFGQNVEIDIRRYLRRIEKLNCADGRTDDICFVEIEIPNYWTVKLTLALNYGDAVSFREAYLVAYSNDKPITKSVQFQQEEGSIDLGMGLLIE